MRGVYCDGTALGSETTCPSRRRDASEVILRVRTVGICDTDLQLARGYMGFRGVLGHEFVGQTETGRRVTAEINNACHDCPTCLRRPAGPLPPPDGPGHPRPRRGDGRPRPGPRPQPPRRSPTRSTTCEAVFIEPLAAAFRIAEQVELGPDVAMAILGDGKLGLLCAWVARLSGARVTLVGKHPREARTGGRGDRHAHPGSVRSTCASRSTSSSTAPARDSGLPTALGLVRPCGTVVLKTTVAGQYTIDLAPIVIDEVRVVGSRCGPFPKAIAALARRQIDVRPLIGVASSTSTTRTRPSRPPPRRGRGRS